MATEKVTMDKGESAVKVREITFKCKFCGRTKPIREMVVPTRFYPPVTACRDCDKETQ